MTIELVFSLIKLKKKHKILFFFYLTHKHTNHNASIHPILIFNLISYIFFSLIYVRICIKLIFLLINQRVNLTR